MSCISCRYFWFVKYSHFTFTMCYYLNVHFQGERFNTGTMEDFHEIKIFEVCCQVTNPNTSNGTQLLILHSVTCLTHERYLPHYKELGLCIPIYLTKYVRLYSPHIGFVVEVPELSGSVNILGLVVKAI